MYLCNVMQCSLGASFISLCVCEPTCTCQLHFESVCLSSVTITLRMRSERSIASDRKIRYRSTPASLVSNHSPSNFLPAFLPLPTGATGTDLPSNRKIRYRSTPVSLVSIVPATPSNFLPLPTGSACIDLPSNFPPSLL